MDFVKTLRKGGTMNVLIIGTNTALNELIVEIVTLRGFSAIQAESEKQGLEIFGKEKIDIVLADLNALTLDGPYLLIRSRFGVDLPIYVMRDFNPYLSNEKVYYAGANHVYEKPFDFGLFLKQLDAHNMKLGRTLTQAA